MKVDVSQTVLEMILRELFINQEISELPVEMQTEHTFIVCSVPQENSPE